jgi:hypothetical protein
MSRPYRELLRSRGVVFRGIRISPRSALTSGDVGLRRDLLAVFGDAVDDKEAYAGAPPSEDYLRSLLNSDPFIALAALQGDAVVGGLAAYVLRKFEQETPWRGIGPQESKSHQRTFPANAAVLESGRHAGETLLATMGGFR